MTMKSHDVVPDPMWMKISAQSSADLTRGQKASMGKVNEPLTRNPNFRMCMLYAAGMNDGALKYTSYGKI